MYIQRKVGIGGMNGVYIVSYCFSTIITNFKEKQVRLFLKENKAFDFRFVVIWCNLMLPNPQPHTNNHPITL